MDSEAARQVADAILFEGYVLYPYRASAVKNQARWQFGVLAPPGSDEASGSQTECLLDGVGPDGARLQVTVRFLQVQRRTGEQPWDEGVLREIAVSVPIRESVEDELRHAFALDGGSDDDPDGTRRQRWPLRGAVVIRATPLPGPYGLVRVRITVSNETEAGSTQRQRPELLRHSLVAAHSVLAVEGGQFVSLLEPPEWAAAAVAGCQNVHTWPVLVGPGRGDVMLSSPIILYDYPEVAAESPGDMCDATEMDEMLVLRALTLTDEEKAEARATDARAADILDLAETMPAEMMDRLHGAIRYLRAMAPDGRPGDGAEPGQPGLDIGPGPGFGRGPGLETGPGARPWWDPGADASVSPETDRVQVAGGEVGRGGKVRLRPRTSGTDAQDMFLRDRIATVEAVVSDVDGVTHIAVSLDDDPAADLNVGRYRYFLPAEVELVPSIAPGDPAASIDTVEGIGALPLPEPRVGEASPVGEQR